ncbi:hypothetical protein [Ralstonia mannitolilytica]|uniref:hypothetical protein n=1 Tax=Ralstonia mannitolilytica TaxID=105219 RepID=UPI00374A0D84
MSEPMARRSGPLHRISSSDFAVAEEVLKTAALLIVPEDQKQRQAFEKLMPHLYVLRNKGCSWPQLTKLLGECGFNLQPSTVRAYFSEMLATRMDVCQGRMNEQIALLAAIRSETAGADVSAISGRVNAFMERLQQSAAPKLDAMFGLPSTPPNGRVIEAEPATPAGPARVPGSPQPSRPVRPRPAARKPPQGAESDDGHSDAPTGEFGLLGLSTPSQAPSNGPTGFFTLDRDPSSPVPAAESPESKNPRGQARAPIAGGATSVAPAPEPAEAAQAHTAGTPAPGPIRKRISPLQDGVPALKPRDGVPAHVYQPGELEHPAIPGLVLTLEQRLYGAGLEYCDQEGDEAGVLKVETPDEKRFRVTWRQRVPMTQTRTGSSFTKMDPALFPTKS